jgi:predicted transcriptional regulator
MDRVFSARVDESVVERIAGLARQLKVPKKSIIEQAVAAFAEQVESEGKGDVFEQTFGAWRRRESAGETVRRARAAFRQSLERRRR